MTDLNIMINSISDERIISFFEKPKILKTKFCYSLTLPWTIIALEITIKPITIVTADIKVTAINTLFELVPDWTQTKVRSLLGNFGFSKESVFKEGSGSR